MALQLRGILIEELEWYTISTAAVVASFLNKGRWSLTMTVGTSFVGKVTSLDTSNIVDLSKVCARTLLSSSDRQLQGVSVHACI